MPDPSGLGLFQHTWRLLDGYIWIMSDAVTSGSLISWDFPVICLGDDLFRGKRITGTHLYHVVLWLILIGDTEVVLLVPVTFPPGAQAAHTSATDGHTSSFETLSNKDHSLIKSLCSHCSHAVTRHSFQMLRDPLWFFFFFFFLVWLQASKFIFNDGIWRLYTDTIIPQSEHLVRRSNWDKSTQRKQSASLWRLQLLNNNKHRRLSLVSFL